MNPIKIVSRHATVAEAVKAAGFSRPMYENSVAEQISMIDSGSRKHGHKPCTKAFVVEAFSNSARIYEEMVEVLYVTECDIDILNRFEIGGCLDCVPFDMLVDTGEQFEALSIKLPKTYDGRKIIREFQQLSRDGNGKMIYAASGIS